MRKSKADQTVEQIYIYYFIQYFERHCISSSGCYKLWLKIRNRSNVGFMYLRGMFWLAHSLSSNSQSQSATLSFIENFIALSLAMVKSLLVCNQTFNFTPLDFSLTPV